MISVTIYVRQKATKVELCKVKTNKKDINLSKIISEILHFLILSKQSGVVELDYTKKVQKILTQKNLLWDIVPVFLFNLGLD